MRNEPVCSWFSPLLREVFLQLHRFFHFLKKTTLNGKHGHVSTSFKQRQSAFWLAKSQLTIFYDDHYERIVQESLSDETANQYGKFHLKKLQNSAMKHDTLVIKRQR